MTYKEACERSGIRGSEAEILLADLLQVDRTWLLAHATEQIPDTIATRLSIRAQRRKTGEPVAYITGTQEFFGRTFIVNNNVLIPRPSTEALIGLTLDVLAGRTGSLIRDADTEIAVFAKLFGDLSHVKTIVDIGTGSGCIAVTLAKETGLKILATDVSAGALAVAECNAMALGASVDFRLGKNLEPVKDLHFPFLMVSNPPYIPDSTKLSTELVDFEPHSALFGGSDGADLLRMIIKQAKEHPMCRGVVLECRTEQRERCFPDVA